MNRLISVAAMAILGLVGFNLPADKDLQPIEVAVQESVSVDELFDRLEKEREVVNELKLLFAETESDMKEIFARLDQIESNSLTKQEVDQIVTEAVQQLKVELTKERETLSVAIDEIGSNVDEIKASNLTRFVMKDDTSEKIADHEARIAALEKAVEELKSPKLSAVAPSPVSQSPYGTVVASNGAGCTGTKVMYCDPSVSYSPVVTYSPTVTYQSVVRSDGGGGCTGSYAKVAVASAPDTKRVKIVEPREPRRVSFAEVPEYQEQVSVQSAMPMQQCYTDEYGNTTCNNGVAVTSSQPQARPGLLGRIFRR